MLKDHRAKYGENLIIQSNRVPLFGYELIDKQWFDVQNTAGAPSVLSFYCGDAAFGQQIRNLAG